MEKLTLTIPEVAEALGISRAKAYELAHSNGFPHTILWSPSLSSQTRFRIVDRKTNRKRGQRMQSIANSFPASLLDMPRWVCWKRVTDSKRPNKPRKVPMAANGNSKAACNRPSTWGAFSQASETCTRKEYDGLGFMLGDGVFGIDIDHCLSDGQPNELAREIINRVPTYAEISPSGTGLHLLALGSLPNGNRGRRKGALEIYGEGRYFTVTGEQLPGTPSELCEASAVLPGIIADYIDSKPKQADNRAVKASSQPVDVLALDNEKLINKIRASSQGAAFCTLWRGDTSAHNGDASAADMALCNILAFWTGKDSTRMDELFRQSGLMRPKWDETHGPDTYGAMTIGKAINDCKAVYTGKRPQLQPVDEFSVFYPFEQAYAKIEGYCSERGKLLQEKTDKSTGEITYIPLATFTPLIREEITRDNGAEARKEFIVDAISTSGRVFPSTTVPAKSFSGMSWVAEAFGAEANIYAGQNKRDQLRFAVQAASIPNMERRTVYSHSGWREINGRQCYLFNGGAIGTAGLSVELEGNLSAYSLPETNIPLLDAIQASKSFLDIGTLHVTAPLLCAMYLAPLCSFLRESGFAPAFVPFVAGRTGTHKTTICALALSHFGRFSNKQPPASFSDTANSIRHKAFLLKDMPLLVDDYHPNTDQRSRARMAEIAQQLARAWGDQSERGRMQSDLTVKLAEPPRGLGIMSGEEVPDIGESGIARFYAIDIHPGDVPITPALTALQNKARSGALIRAMRGFIEYIQPQTSGLSERLAGLFEYYRAEAIKRMPKAHGRSHESIAWLMVGAACMLGYWLDNGVITDEERNQFTLTIQAALVENANEQQKSLRGENPVTLFLNGLRELLHSNAVRLAHIEKDGSIPIGGYDDLVGYADTIGAPNRLVYLFPQVAYASVQKLFRDQGNAFPINRTQLWKRLREQDILITRQGTKGEELTPTKCIGGHSQRMVWLRAADVFGEDEQMEFGGGQKIV